MKVTRGQLRKYLAKEMLENSRSVLVINEDDNSKGVESSGLQDVSTGNPALDTKIDNLFVCVCE